MDFNDRFPVSALRQDFECDFDTGKIVRKVAAGKMPAGSAAFGSLSGAGYFRGNWRKRLFYAHRVVWAFAHGQWPDQRLQIDHIDRCRTNNSLRNLRLVSRSENMHNLSPYGVSGGPLGLAFSYGNWTVQIVSNGNRFHLGTFPDIRDAVAARYAAEIEHGWPHLGLSLHDRQQQALAYVAGLEKAD